MKIAFVGWGSLIKEPRELPIAGEWREGGPLLRIEFSRISQSGERADCLTLVIDERRGKEVPTFYVLSSRTALSEAVNDLRKREGTPPENIGYCEMATGHFATRAQERHRNSCECIRAWGMERHFDAAVWTALAPRFKDVLGIPYTPAAALNYLNGLPAPTKQRAFKYIQNAPEQTMTPLRRLLLEQYVEFPFGKEQ